MSDKQEQRKAAEQLATIIGKMEVWHQRFGNHFDQGGYVQTYKSQLISVLNKIEARQSE